MRFRKHQEGNDIFRQLFPDRPAMLMYCCSAGDWNFVISYDTLHNVWGASYQAKYPGSNRVTSTPCEKQTDGRPMLYPTQNEAEKACEKKYRQLRKDN
jgi:hypothetical protein